jgi:hypothetical protein
MGRLGYGPRGSAHPEGWIQEVMLGQFQDHFEVHQGPAYAYLLVFRDHINSHFLDAQRLDDLLINLNATIQRIRTKCNVEPQNMTNEQLWSGNGFPSRGP